MAKTICKIIWAAENNKQRANKRKTMNQTSTDINMNHIHAHTNSLTCIAQKYLRQTVSWISLEALSSSRAVAGAHIQTFTFVALAPHMNIGRSTKSGSPNPILGVVGSWVGVFSIVGVVIVSDIGDGNPFGWCCFALVLWGCAVCCSSTLADASSSFGWCCFVAWHLGRLGSYQFRRSRTLRSPNRQSLGSLVLGLLV